VGYLLFTVIKFSLMILELSMKPFGRPSICMSRTKEDQISKRLGMTIRGAIWIKGRQDSSHLSSGIIYSHIYKGRKHTMNLIL
jgi:hypothetical protein